jgi:hypothetical protein
LESFNLFNTTYLVDRPIEYGFGVEADAVRVPEPSTLVLLGFGVAALAGTQRWQGLARCNARLRKQVE